MTRRDLQAVAKKAGRPWEVGKAFEHAAPCSAIAPAAAIGHPDRGAVALEVNGEERQSGDLAQLIWKVPEIISYLSGLFALAGGDLVFTGTPSGVGPVARGDRLHGRVAGVRRDRGGSGLSRTTASVAAAGRRAGRAVTALAADRLAVGRDVFAFAQAPIAPAADRCRVALQSASTG